MKDRSWIFYLVLFLIFIALGIFLYFYKEKTKPPEIELEEAFLFFREGETLFEGPLYSDENYEINLEAVLKGKKDGKEVYFSNYKNIILKKSKIPEEKILNFENFPYILKFLWFTFEPERIYYYIDSSGLEEFKWKIFFIKDTTEPSFSPPFEAQNTSFLEKPPFGEFLGKYYGTMRYSLRVEIYDRRAPRVPFKVLHSANLENPDSAQMVIKGKGERTSTVYYFTSYGNLPFFSIPSGNLQILKDTINKLIKNRWAFGTLLFCQPEEFKSKVESVLWDGENLLSFFGKPLIWGKDLEEGDSMISQKQIIIFYEKEKGKVSKEAKILSHTKTPLVIGSLKDIPPDNFTLIRYIK